MINRRSTFFFGLIIFLLPFIGLPTLWKTVLSVAVGFILVISSIDFSFHKKISKPRHKKEKPVEHVYESIPLYSKDNVVEEPIVENIQVQESKPIRRKATRKPKNIE